MAAEASESVVGWMLIGVEGFQILHLEAFEKVSEHGLRSKISQWNKLHQPFPLYHPQDWRLIRGVGPSAATFQTSNSRPSSEASLAFETSLHVNLVQLYDASQPQASGGGQVHAPPQPPNNSKHSAVGTVDGFSQFVDAYLGLYLEGCEEPDVQGQLRIGEDCAGPIVEPASTILAVIPLVKPSPTTFNNATATAMEASEATSPPDLSKHLRTFNLRRHERLDG